MISSNMAILALEFGLLCGNFYLAALLWRKLNQLTNQAREIQEKLERIQK